MMLLLCLFVCQMHLQQVPPAYWKGIFIQGTTHAVGFADIATHAKFLPGSLDVQKHCR